MKRKIPLFLVILLALFMIIFYISRNPLITDDITPISSCKQIMQKSDILFVIPNYKGNSLDNYPRWCEEKRTLNKTIGLHGITHEYQEFLKPVNKAELGKAINSFENCFGYKPTLFRPPYNKISPENKALVESFNMTLYKDNYLLHPYCHCEPHGRMKILNWVRRC